jgi:hypothetical protein
MARVGAAEPPSFDQRSGYGLDLLPPEFHEAFAA